MKEQFRNSIKKVESWAKDRNFFGPGGTTAQKQILKLYEEFGEMSGSIAKNRDYTDDIGDQIVVLTNVLNCSGVQFSAIDFDFSFDEKLVETKEECVAMLGTCYAEISKIIFKESMDWRELVYHASLAIYVLEILARKNGNNVLDCLNHAYDEIKDRKGRMVNSVFVKESDLVKNETDHKVRFKVLKVIDK